MRNGTGLTRRVPPRIGMLAGAIPSTTSPGAPPRPPETCTANQAFPGKAGLFAPSEGARPPLPGVGVPYGEGEHAVVGRLASRIVSAATRIPVASTLWYPGAQTGLNLTFHVPAGTTTR